MGNISLNKKLGESIISSASSKYAAYIVQLASLSILARLFSPETFGLVASVHVFAMFFQMVSNTGIAPAIVYQDNLTDNERDGIYSFTFIFGIFTSLIFLSLWFIVEFIYPFYIHFAILLSLSIFVFMSTISTLPVAALQKDRMFKYIAISEILGELVSLIFVFLMIGFFDDYLILAMKYSISQIFRAIFYYTFSKKTRIGKANFGTQINHTKLIFSFAKNQVFFNILNYFSRNLDNILVAKYFGVTSLGLYEKTYQLMRYPLQVFTFAINPALMPVLTEHKHEPEHVSKSYYKIAYILSLLGVFSGLVMFFSAESIIFIIFGNDWLDAALYLKVFAISIPIQMVLSSTGGVFQAFGKTKEMLLCGLFSASTNIFAIVTGIYFESLYLMCVFLVFSFSLNLFQCLFILNKHALKTKQIETLKLGVLCISLWPILNFYDLSVFLPNNLMEAFFHLLRVLIYSILLLAIPAIYYRQKVIKKAISLFKKTD